MRVAAWMWISVACESRFEAKSAKLRATSRRISALGESARRMSGFMTPSSIMRSCVRPSTISAMLAIADTACSSRCSSLLIARSRSAGSAPPRASDTLFSSDMARLQMAAAASRCTSIEFDFAAMISGSSAPSRMICTRRIGCVARPRSAATAWNCTFEEVSVPGKA